MTVRVVRLLTEPVADSADPATFAERANRNFKELNDILRDINAAGIDMNDIAADLVASNLPDLSGKGGQILGVTNDETGATFLGPKEALGDSGFRNKIINGLFEVNQRGTGPWTTNDYTSDRWKLRIGEGATYEANCIVPNKNNDIIVGPLTRHMKIERTVAGSNVLDLAQEIEGVRTLQGQKATLTFWVRAESATQVRGKFAQVFGTGGTVSPLLLTSTDLVNVGTGWTKFSEVVDIPNTTGKDIGTNGDDTLRVSISWPNDADNPAPNTLFISNVSVVAGDATQEEDPGSWRSLGQEIELCKRYYQVIDRGNSGSINCESGPRSRVYHVESSSFPVSMRKNPTVSREQISFVGCTFEDIQANQSGYIFRVSNVTTPYNIEVNGGKILLDAEY